MGSVDSVGEYTQQAVLWVLWVPWNPVEDPPCQEVLVSPGNPGGEYTQQAVLWVLWIPWENILSKQFCVNL